MLAKIEDIDNLREETNKITTIREYIIDGDVITVKFFRGSLTNLKTKNKTIMDLDIKVKEMMEEEVKKNVKNMGSVMPIKLSLFMIALMIFAPLFLNLSLLWGLLPSSLIAINIIYGRILTHKIMKDKIILDNLERVNQELANNKFLQANISLSLVKELKKSQYANIYSEKDLIFSYNGAKKAKYKTLRDLLQTIENIKSLPEDVEVKVKKRGDLEH